MTIFGQIAEVNLFRDLQRDSLTWCLFPFELFHLFKSATFHMLIDSQQPIGFTIWYYIIPCLRMMVDMLSATLM